MSMKVAYEQKLQAQLDEWKAEIDKLKAKAGKVEASARTEFHRHIDDLQLKFDAAKKKMQTLQNAGDAWEDLKTGLDNAWKSLSDALKSATSHFK